VTTLRGQDADFLITARGTYS